MIRSPLDKNSFIRNYEKNKDKEEYKAETRGPIE